MMYADQRDPLTLPSFIILTPLYLPNIEIDSCPGRHWQRCQPIRNRFAATVRQQHRSRCTCRKIKSSLESTRCEQRRTSTTAIILIWQYLINAPFRSCSNARWKLLARNSLKLSNTLAKYVMQALNLLPISKVYYRSGGLLVTLSRRRLKNETKLIRAEKSSSCLNSARGR